MEYSAYLLNIYLLNTFVLGTVLGIAYSVIRKENMIVVTAVLWKSQTVKHVNKQKCS